MEARAAKEVWTMLHHCSQTQYRLTVGALTFLLVIGLFGPAGSYALAAGQTLRVGPDQDYDTLQSALSAAHDGDVLIVTGEHQGTFVIDKPVILRGEARAVLDGNNRGTVLTITAPGVVVENLTIRNSGSVLEQEHAGITIEAANVVIRNNRLEEILFGVYLKESPNALVEENVIMGKDLPLARRGDGIRAWYSSGTEIHGNSIYGTRDLIIWFTNDAVVTGNLCRGGRYGIHVMYSDGAVLRDNTLTQNSVGTFVMYSRNVTVEQNRLIENRGPTGYGIGLKDLDNVTIRNNRVSRNKLGIYGDNSPRSVDAFIPL